MNELLFDTLVNNVKIFGQKVLVDEVFSYYDFDLLCEALNRLGTALKECKEKHGV